jgi:hypothetical protein
MDAPLNEQAKRPKKADGTADWETIFEDPANGLIPLVAGAHTIEGLKACATLVINQLFTRKNDAPERDRLNDLLNKLMESAQANGGVEAARNGVIGLLRSIKQERLLKAAAYVAKKRQKPEATERERRKAGGAFLGDVHHLFASKTSSFAIVGGLVLVVLALIGIGLYLGLEKGGTSVATETPASMAAKPPAVKEEILEAAPLPKPPVEKMDQAAPSKPATGKEKTKEKAVAAVRPNKPEYPKPVYFTPMYWVLKTTDMRRGYTYYQPMITIADAKAYSALCTRLPTANDIFNLAMSRAHPDGGSADARQLADAGRWAVAQLNEKFGQGSVTRVDFLRDGDPNFSSRAIPCR